MALFRFGERTLCGWCQNLGIGRHFDLARSIWLTGRYESYDFSQDDLTLLAVRLCC
jgi:hypothetical protein